MNANLIKEWCPRCKSKLDVVTVKECQHCRTAVVKVLDLRCPDVRCGFSIQDFEVISQPQRPAGTPMAEKPRDARWHAEHRERNAAYCRAWRARKAAMKAGKA